MPFGFGGLLATTAGCPLAPHASRGSPKRMASFAGDDYALERRKLQELQARGDRSTTPGRLQSPAKSAGADQRPGDRRRGRGGEAVASGPQGRGHAPGGGARGAWSPRRAESAHARCVAEGRRVRRRSVLRLTSPWRRRGGRGRGASRCGRSRFPALETERSDAEPVALRRRARAGASLVPRARDSIREELKTTRRAMRRGPDARRDADAARAAPRPIWKRRASNVRTQARRRRAKAGRARRGGRRGRGRRGGPARGARTDAALPRGTRPAASSPRRSACAKTTAAHEAEKQPERGRRPRWTRRRENTAAAADAGRRDRPCGGCRRRAASATGHGGTWRKGRAPVARRGAADCVSKDLVARTREKKRRRRLGAARPRGTATRRRWPGTISRERSRPLRLGLRSRGSAGGAPDQFVAPVRSGRGPWKSAPRSRWLREIVERGRRCSASVFHRLRRRARLAHASRTRRRGAWRIGAVLWWDLVHTPCNTWHGESPPRPTEFGRPRRPRRPVFGCWR